MFSEPAPWDLIRHDKTITLQVLPAQLISKFNQAIKKGFPFKGWDASAIIAINNPRDSKTYWNWRRVYNQETKSKINTP